MTIHERTRVVGLERVPRGVRVRTVPWSAERDEPFGHARRFGLSVDPGQLVGRVAGTDEDRQVGDEGGLIEAGHVVIATSAYSGWYPRLAGLFVPVYDYVLVSEPLDAGGARRSAGPAARE